MMDRRKALSLLTTMAAPLLTDCDRQPGTTDSAMTERSAPAGRMPAIFLAHGAPPLLEDATWMGELRAWAGALPRPTAVLMISAHWTARPLTLGATRTVPLIYDFYGFPQRYYETKYPAPGAKA